MNEKWLKCDEDAIACAQRRYSEVEYLSIQFDVILCFFRTRKSSGGTVVPSVKKIQDKNEMKKKRIKTFTVAQPLFSSSSSYTISLAIKLIFVFAFNFVFVLNDDLMYINVHHCCWSCMTDVPNRDEDDDRASRKSIQR